jgi:hypothetical protein
VIDCYDRCSESFESPIPPSFSTISGMFIFCLHASPNLHNNLTIGNDNCADVCVTHQVSNEMALSEGTYIQNIHSSCSFIALLCS